MTKSNLSYEFINAIKSIEGLQILTQENDRLRYSRDFYDYSPILLKKLNKCCAELVVRPETVKSVNIVASLCNKYNIYLTIRGSGTGNYGQSVPLRGGVVMVMNLLTDIRHFDEFTGQVTVETGCSLRDLDKFLSNRGRQLKILPSTWRSASVGGFLSGGSGGIGSVRWGFLRDPGHLIDLEIVTMDNPSKIVTLDASQSEPINHAYGTNGIITALTITTAPLIHWHQIVIDISNWSEAVDLIKCCAQSATEIYLLTLLENKIVNCLPDWVGKSKNKHRVLLLVSPDSVRTIERISQRFDSEFISLGPEKLTKGSGLRELTWNHTTLHMRSSDKNWTYLQMLLPKEEIKLMDKLKKIWGDDLLWHLEVVRQYGSQRIASLPVVRWRDKDSMELLIDQCKELGAVVFNPHVITVEDGGLGVIDSDQVNAKKKNDPKGLLNPGKLKGWSNNR